MVEGDTDHIDFTYSCRAQQVVEGPAVAVDAFEAGICRGVHALAHARVDAAGYSVECRVQLGLRGAGHAVGRPCVDEVGLVAEVITRVDVPVLGSHYQVVAVVAGEQVGHIGGDVVATLDPECAAFAEGGLHVHDEQGCAGPSAFGMLIGLLSHVCSPAPRRVPPGAAVAAL